MDESLSKIERNKRELLRQILRDAGGFVSGRHIKLKFNQKYQSAPSFSKIFFWARSFNDIEMKKEKRKNGRGNKSNVRVYKIKEKD